MPEIVSALVYLGIVGCVSFLVQLRLSRKIGYQDDVRRFYVLWFILTFIVFVANNYWIFCLAAIFVLYRLPRNDTSFIASAYLFLLFCLPQLENTIPGFGIIDRIMEISWPKIVSIGLLIPIALSIGGNIRKFEIRMSGYDVLVKLFVIIICLLVFRNTSFTEGIRQVIEKILYIFLPYFVISRSITSFKDIARMQHAAYCIIFLMAAIGIFSSIKVWHPYISLGAPLGLPAETITSYKYRAGFLRASAVLGSINLGLMTVVAISFGLSFYSAVKERSLILLHYGVLLSCLFLTFSRGPWVGLVAVIAMAVLMSKNKPRAFLGLGMLSMIASPFLFLTETGQTFIDLLPFIGTAEDSTVSYRELLFEVSLAQMNDYPFFGSPTFMRAPRMQVLIQGEGIIDIVNTYLEVGLLYGYFTMAIFISLMLFPMFSVLRYLKYQTPENVQIGVSLILAMIAIITVIATVSSLKNEKVFAFIFSMIGMLVGYINLCNKNSASVSNS